MRKCRCHPGQRIALELDPISLERAIDNRLHRLPFVGIVGHLEIVIIHDLSFATDRPSLLRMGTLDGPQRRREPGS